MAEKKKKTVSRRMWLVDPIYRKFSGAAFRSLTSGEFYDFFRTMLMNGEHEFQFSNRKLDMKVDESWVNIIEDTIPAFIEIARNPRVLITQEELITSVVQAKKIDSTVVKHLCSHSYLVDAVDEAGEVRPSKVLNIFKEETWDTYENRFVYTLMKKTYDFVSKRYRDMQKAMNDEFGATLLINSSASSAMESMSIKSEMKINQIDDLFDTEGKQKSIFARIKEIFEALQSLMATRFAKEMSKFLKVDPPLVPTNAIKKNPYLKKCHKLWNFLLAYFDVGFTVEIIEQNPEINERFEQDIFNNIAFTYIILKAYLEDNRDRAMDRNVRAQRRTLRPRYIKEIVEEFVRDFNMTDVEVRKVLIEQLTKEQLLREEQAERYRIVEEHKRAEEERQRQAEEERQRIRREKERAARQKAREKEQEKARREKEKAKEALRLQKEKERREALDAARAAALEKELEQQMEAISERRAKAAGKKAPAKKKKPAAEKEETKTRRSKADEAAMLAKAKSERDVNRSSGKAAPTAKAGTEVVDKDPSAGSGGLRVDRVATPTQVGKDGKAESSFLNVGLQSYQEKPAAEEAPTAKMVAAPVVVPDETPEEELSFLEMGIQSFQENRGELLEDIPDLVPAPGFEPLPEPEPAPEPEPEPEPAPAEEPAKPHTLSERLSSLMRRKR